MYKNMSPIKHSLSINITHETEDKLKKVEWRFMLLLTMDNTIVVRPARWTESHRLSVFDEFQRIRIWDRWGWEERPCEAKICINHPELTDDMIHTIREKINEMITIIV